MSTSYEINGTIHSIGDTQQIKETFTKREIIVAVEDGNYTNHVTVQFTKDKCKELDSYKPGDVVTILFNLGGRLYTSKDGIEKAFTNLNAWKISKQGASPIVDKTEAFDDVPF